MTLTAGTLSIVATGSTTAQVVTTNATGGTGPYTVQWYRSTTSGFTPGSGNLVSGATALTLNDSGLIPGTQYYYEVIYTDTGNSNTTVDSTQLALLTTAPVLNPNQFAQLPYLGMLDLKFDFDTVSVLIDVSQVGGLTAGAAVKMVNSANGVPKVVGCAADSDNVLGFIIFDIKTVTYVAGVAAEISLFGNCQYLYATGPINRGAQVTLDLTTVGGVAQKVGSSGNSIVGWAYDQAPAAGALFRVMVQTPSFAVA